MLHLVVKGTRHIFVLDPQVLTASLLQSMVLCCLFSFFGAFFNFNLHVQCMCLITPFNFFTHSVTVMAVLVTSFQLIFSQTCILQVDVVNDTRIRRASRRVSFTLRKVCESEFGSNLKIFTLELQHTVNALIVWMVYGSYLPP